MWVWLVRLTKTAFFDKVTKQMAINMLQKQMDKMMHSNSATKAPYKEEQQEKKCTES